MSRNRMGRPKSAKNRHLPPRMSARKLATRTLYYYRTRTGGAIPLGADLAAAREKWAQLENGGCLLPTTTVASVLADYEKRGIGDLAVKTRKEYGLAIVKLTAAFGKADLMQVQPFHVRQYLDRRTAKVAGNREIAVLSAAWNWARERGITALPNPCLNIRNKERARKVYVTDAMFLAVYRKGDQVLRDAMALARITGQREGDLLKMRRDDIRDGCLWVRQGKTGKALRIEVSGSLAKLVKRLACRRRTATGPFLIQTDAGQRVTYAMLRKRFDAAREASGQTWQFRDLRAKSATDADDLKHAQALLGHQSESTTAEVYRRTAGEKVRPIGSKNLERVKSGDA